MNVPEIERRIQEIEAELTALKVPLAGARPKNPRWYRDNAGVLAGDPAADEAYRLGKEWRDEVNRLSLEEFDREEAEAGTARAVS